MPYAPVQTILVDFDGTISPTDVGNALFNRATGGAFLPVVEAWKAGRISSRRCLITESSLARITREEVLAFALDQPVDPDFNRFYRKAVERNIDVRVVSDGLDVYIRALLGREGLEAVRVESNRAHFVENRLLPAFPFAGRGCGRCGNCKGGAVDAARASGGVGFIGDGLSDRCGARNADWVFTKAGRDLERICREENVAHTAFQNFNDILSALEWN